MIRYVRNFTSLLALRYMYLGFSNVLHIWCVQAIPTYRVYRLYDRYHMITRVSYQSLDIVEIQTPFLGKWKVL